MKLPFIIALFTYSLILTKGYAQEQMPKTNSIDTNSTINKKKERPKRVHYMTIIKTNTKGILYGNKCFEEFTKSIGFVYSVQIKGKSGSASGFIRFWHNGVVKTTLVFKAGPWWKLRANKKKKDCRKLSGDFVG